MVNSTLEAFVGEFSSRAVLWREDEFTSRSGATSHWYVDTRGGLSRGALLRSAAEHMLQKTQKLGIKFTHVAGNGVGGRMFVSPLGIVAAEQGIDLYEVWANDDKTDTHYLNGYGLHGAGVEGERVLPVDDIAMTGSSTVTLIKMLRDAGAIVEDALYLTDRSHGQAAETLGKLGINTHALLSFDDASGTLTAAT